MFENIKKLIRNRHLHIAIILSIVTFVLIVRLVDWQIINGKVIDYQASVGYYSTRDIPAQRGKIYDRNGKLIAYNRTGYVVQLVPSNVPTEERNRMYLKIVNILEKNGDTYEKSLERFLQFSPLRWGSYLEGDDEDAKTKRENWKETIVVKKSDVELLNTPEDVYNYMRDVLFKIDESYTEEETQKIMYVAYEAHYKGVSAKNPLILSSDISIKSMSEIEARHLELPGIATEEVYFREYVDGRTVAHILGYVRPMSGEEYENIYKEKGYALDEIVGKEGIERAAEEYLRGTKGKKTVYVDRNGRELREISSIPPLPGNDIYLTIDLELQKVALESLKKNIELIASQKNNTNNHGDCNAGAVVVSNPKTGEILAMVSYPDFDPSIFLAPKTDQEAQKAIQDLYTDTTKSASLNRASQGLYQPGSTFKLLTGIAGLETGKITANTRYTCRRVGVYDGMEIRCLAHHGSISLVPAITRSCNIYFYDAGIDIGINSLDAWMRNFGLGEYTGIEIPEYKGRRSNIDTMKAVERDQSHIWGRADTAQTSIGQLYHQYTPLQLLNFGAAFGNGGYLTKSFLIQKAVSYDGRITFQTEPELNKIDVSDDNLKIINQGMLGVINDANNRVEQLFKDFPVQVAGKTGTPQHGMEALGRSSHGVFVGYAPADDPEIAVSIVLEYGVWGANCTPIAKDIFEKYFNIGQYEDPDYNLPSQEPVIIP